MFDFDGILLKPGLLPGVHVAGSWKLVGHHRNVTLIIAWL